MAIPGWLIRTSWWPLAVLAVVAAGWYSPAVTAAIWHIYHPRGWVDYRGLHVLVPWPWTSDVDAVKADPTAYPEGISEKRTGYTMVGRGPAQAIFVTVISADPGVTAEQQTKAWMSSFRATHQGRAFDEATPVAIPEGARCLSARSPGNQQDVVWTCISMGGGWVAGFEGRTSEETAFFRIVASLKP